MIRRPPRSTLSPTRRSSDLVCHDVRQPCGRPPQAGGQAVGQRNPPLTSRQRGIRLLDRKSTRLNSSHVRISYAVFCLKKKKKSKIASQERHDQTPKIWAHPS